MSDKHRLPVVEGGKSTAATTAFCAEKIDVGNGQHLWVDGNAKITASLGSLEEPKPNAFSILQVDDCPYRTPSCEASCYVHGLEKHAKDTHDLYQHNSETIRGWFDDPPLSRAQWRVACLAAKKLADWIEQNCKEFRWHVSGDVFSAEYALWIRGVCAMSPGIGHWIYTRSFADKEILDCLLDVGTCSGGNLEINLSADKDNYWLARRVADEHGLRVCYMTTDGSVPDDLQPGDVIFPDYSLRAPKTKMVEMINADIAQPMTPSEQREASPWWQSLTGPQQRMVCPVDFYGKSEGNRCGPCSRCMEPS